MSGRVVTERGAGGQVVLLHEDGTAAGVADKTTVHGPRTPLHLAFSCYVFDADGHLLLTRRARAKSTFPGVWTNTACGHPEPGEALRDAVHRRVGEELGLTLGGLRPVLPGFRYRAEQDGIVEHEMCPVFVAHTDATPRPEPTEVQSARRVAWEPFVRAAIGGAWPALSPWCREQVDALAALGDEPADWATGDPGDLPAAARL